MSRMSRRGRRDDNILVFGRKLKIVEIVRLPTLPREKCGSGPLFFLRRLPFFSSPSFCLPPHSIPRYAVFISTNCSKRRRE